ncbi:uncharacterized protein LOC141656023 [Silene latifolia]|uniref:uncharacterized protein LOC141656023 n=1 Tax=Silene latifolia TaxID=37657 RepID=UPI003D77F3F7
MFRVKHQESYTNYNYDINKSQLAIDTFNIYHNSLHSSSSCIHLNRIQSPSVDWYLILRVEEDASIGTIRKQYHKLALLLHPDKNKHPKAEFSFKLISQAYKCLSDNARRSSFNLERWRNRCTKCNRTSHPTGSPSHQTTPFARHETGSRKTPTSREVPNDFSVLREKLKEEARVIENCMRFNRASKDEYPVFDPSNYANVGYPHRRPPQFINKKAANSWSMQKENVDLNYDRRNRCEKPIFELRTNSRNLNINSTTCVGS